MRESRGDDAVLAQRIRAVREQLFGDRGGPMLATLLGIPERRLARIEAGAPVAAEVILRLIDVTSVNPRWLLSGQGERYNPPAPRHSGRPGAGSRLDG